ncbi:hypothetical protein DW107_13925 [Tannerella sp. AM09-19]|nr:hypothetical protein DW107_13925 [Tannerella sp. AM09-19]
MKYKTVTKLSYPIMKKLYSLCLVCCFAGILQAQTKIRYSYDASGNRVKREIVLSRVQNRALDRIRLMLLSFKLKQDSILLFAPISTMSRVTRSYVSIVE